MKTVTTIIAVLLLECVVEDCCVFFCLGVCLCTCLKYAYGKSKTLGERQEEYCVVRYPSTVNGRKNAFIVSFLLYVTCSSIRTTSNA